MTQIAAASVTDSARHPLGSKAKVLLVSIFGPYALDDANGSRELNPMELYHHQVTRVQHAFSFRTFHRSWGLMLIQVNVQADCTVLDFPTLERFVEEITTQKYDVIGISGIPTNLFKVRKMCKLVRKHLPEATLLIGGHIANVPDLDRWCDADHIVKGEGVRWMRRFLGEDEDAPIQHPRVLANLRTRIMGVMLRDNPGNEAATLIPSVGCPMGCNFCSTSAMFGGKGKFVASSRARSSSSDDVRPGEVAQVQAFFVMDENFLLDRKRARELLELMEKHAKAWSLYVFSSANVLRLYTPDELVRLGVSWVWIGLEGKDSRYAKLKKTDTHALVRELQSHGIRVLGSTIIGLEEHTPENIDDVIEFAVSHATDFHQFMLYTPTPGTPLFAEHQAAGSLKSLAEVNVSDIHGQGQFNFNHPHITEGQEGELLIRAFHRDLAVNGPSIVRIARTTLRGWKRYKNHPDARIRARFAYEAKNLPLKYAGIVWAARQHLRDRPEMWKLMTDLLEEFHAEFGLRSRVGAAISGRYLLYTVRREEKRLAEGWTYEPPTFYERGRP